MFKESRSSALELEKAECAGAGRLGTHYTCLSRIRHKDPASLQNQGGQHCGAECRLETNCLSDDQRAESDQPREPCVRHDDIPSSVARCTEPRETQKPGHGSDDKGANKEDSCRHCPTVLNQRIWRAWRYGCYLALGRLSVRIAGTVSSR